MLLKEAPQQLGKAIRHATTVERQSLRREAGRALGVSNTSFGGEATLKPRRRTTKEKDATRDAIMDGRHQPSDVEPSQAFLACDLGRNLERAEFLARDRLDLGARLDDFDLRRGGPRRQRMSASLRKSRLLAARK